MLLDKVVHTMKKKKYEYNIWFADMPVLNSVIHVKNVSQGHKSLIHQSVHAY